MAPLLLGPGKLESQSREQKPLTPWQKGVRALSEVPQEPVFRQ